jgi:hypothetical protein
VIFPIYWREESELGAVLPGPNFYLIVQPEAAFVSSPMDLRMCLQFFLQKLDIPPIKKIHFKNNYFNASDEF